MADTPLSDMAYIGGRIRHRRYGCNTPLPRQHDFFDFNCNALRVDQKQKTFYTTKLIFFDNQLVIGNWKIESKACWLCSAVLINKHHGFYPICPFCLIKKDQKIKKIRMLHRGKASQQRGLSIINSSREFLVVMCGELWTNWFTRRFWKWLMLKIPLCRDAIATPSRFK